MLGFVANEIKVKQIFKQQLFFISVLLTTQHLEQSCLKFEEVSFPAMAQFQMSQKHYKVYCILEKLIALYCSKFRFTADSLSVVSFSFRWTHFPPKHTQTYIFAHTTHLLCLYNELMQPPPPRKGLLVRSVLCIEAWCLSPQVTPRETAKEKHQNWHLPFKLPSRSSFPKSALTSSCQELLPDSPGNHLSC